MSAADRTKWNARYAQGAYIERPAASEFLRKQIHNATPGYALDVACGAGRNAIFLAKQGFVVDGIDISSVGLARAEQTALAQDVEVSWHCQDLLDKPVFPRRDYQLIVLFRFVAPALLPYLSERLATGGVLIVEEHMVWDGPVTGPGSGRFRVEPGALQASLSDLELIVAQEGEVTEPDGATAALSRLVVRKTV